MIPIKSIMFFVLALLAAVATTSYVSGAAYADSANPTISDDVLDQRIHNYILNHPEVVVEAIQKWQAQQKQAQAQQADSAFKARRSDIFNDPAAPVSGNPAGDVTVVEFMDYNCGYCRKSFPIITQLLEEDSNIRLVLKEFPILGPGSEFASRAALASQRQGRYTEFHSALMQSGQRLEERQVLAIAKQIGLDIERLKKDVADPQLQQSIDRNHQLARALAINGTPSFIIGDEIVRGSVDLAALRRLVKKARDAR